ncbi:MAG: hypothetical protein ABIT61_02235 [Steroidobacteraceae bacterium]
MQRGATLVETLVAAVVLAVGVLGTAVLFLHGLQANRSALMRGQAVGLVADLAERLRARAQPDVELARWRGQVLATLPAPRDGSEAALLQLQPGNADIPDRYRIAVRWSEPGLAAVWTQSQVLDLPAP